MKKRHASIQLTERYDAYSLEDAIIDCEKRCRELATICSRCEEALYNNCNNNDDHADQGECAGFCKLFSD